MKYTVRVGTERLHVSKEARDAINKRAAELGCSVSDYLLKHATQEVHFAEECAGTGQPVQSKEKTVEEILDPDRIPAIVTEMNDFLHAVQDMPRSEIGKLLVKYSNKSRKVVKAAVDSGMYSPNSWAHFLEEATKLGAPPYEVADETARHFKLMVLARAYRGEDIMDLNGELNRLHLEKGRSYQKTPNERSAFIKFGMERDRNRGDNRRLH